MSDRAILSDAELRTPSGRFYYGIALAVLVLLALITIFPFFFAFTSGLKNNIEIFRSGLNIFPETPLWGNYKEVWERFDLFRLLMNSFIVVGGGVIGQLVVSAAAAYALSQLNPPGGRWIMMGFLLTLMIPGISYIVPQYLVIKDLNLLNSYWGVWLPYAISPFAIFVLKTFFDRIPRDIIDSARVDGATTIQIFWRIILPLSRSILIVICIVAFVNLWKDFLLPLLVIADPKYQPITVRLIYLTSRYGVNLQMASSFIGLLPPLLIALFMQRYMTVGLTMGSVKG